MYERILVPLDGSKFSEASLPAAVSIAERAKGEICLLFVFPDRLEVYDRIEGNTGAGRKWAQTYLSGVAATVTASTDRPVTTAVRGGPIAPTIVDEATKSHDMIVMTTHGRGPVSRVWLGSIADECIRLSRRPVLLVHPESAEPGAAREPALDVRTLVVPQDGTEFAESVLPPAMAFAKLFGASIHLVRSVEHPMPVGMVDPIVGFTPDLPTLDELVEGARAHLTRVAEQIQGQGIQVTASVIPGTHPVHAILDEAKAGTAIAIATHGRSGVGRALLGSVTDKVVRAVAVPVLVIPPSGKMGRD
jgi:nucleotide-binding universal stress UspA family protein